MPAQQHSEAERELVETARRVLPGGGFGNVSHEVIIARGHAGHVWDVGGKEYIDYLLGSGPMIVGHAHPEVVEVVQMQAALGTTFFASNEAGFLEGLRKITAENGLVLIFDEVVTGFRFAYGGAQAYYGVTPDICTLGKAIGGGFPLAAIAGRADIMVHFDKGRVGEDKFMLQIGTLSGNPIAAAAGLKTLEILKRPGAYAQIFKTGRALMQGYAEVLERARVKARVVGDAPMFDIVFTDREVKDYRSALGDEALQKRCNAFLRQRGILKGENKYYISLAHTEEDVTFTIDAFAASIAELQGARAA